MSDRFSRNSTLAVAAIIAQWPLHALWQVGLSSLPMALRLSLLALALLPGLPCLIAVLRRQRSAAFWAGVGSLFYFSHGVMEAWVAEQWRLLAWLEIALALLAIFASSIDGLRARFAARKADASR